MKHIYKFHEESRNDGEILYLRADFAQAADPIEWSSDRVDWHSTPFQVADSRHNQHDAFELVCRWFSRQGWTDDELDAEGDTK